MAHLESRAEIVYVTEDSINQDKLLTDCTSHLLMHESGGTLTAWGFHLDRIHHSIVRWQHNVNSLRPNLVCVDGIHGCDYQGHTSMLPSTMVHCFLAALLFVLWWLLLAIPLPYDTYAHSSHNWYTLPNSEGSVIVGQYLHWCTSFVRDGQ